MAGRFDGRVSALIVNFRSYPEVDRCLSALETNAPAAEAIVIDYQPDTAAAASLRQTHPGVCLEPIEMNAGFGAGVNRAARHARGAYFLVLNPDTIVEAGAVATLADWLDDHPATAVVGPLVHTEEGDIEPSARAFPSLSTVLGGRSTWLSRRWPDNPITRRNLLTGAHVTEPVVVDWVSGACMLVRRNAFERVGGFDERFFLYWEDADLCRRLSAAGWNVVYHPGGRAIHAGGRSSRHRRAASTVAFHQSVFRYYLKHSGSWRFVFAPLVCVVLVLRLLLSLAVSVWRRA